MPTLILLALLGFLTGCINIAASLERQDMSVAETREASDCVPIIFGLSYGRASLEGALSEEVAPIGSGMVSNPRQKPAIVPRQKITKIRRVQLHDYQFLFFGARCVEVIGE